MTRETKLGIAFIGILLSVFTVLLVKKLMRPSNRGLNAMVAQSSGEPTAPKTLPAAAPTVVTPNNDSSKGAGLIPFNEPTSSPASSSASASEWSNSSRYPGTSAKTNSASAVPDTVPSVLAAAPLPIPDNDRYRTAATEKPADRYSSNATEASPTSLPYQSAYPAAISDEPAATATTAASTVQVAPIKPVDDIPSRTADSRATES